MSLFAIIFYIIIIAIFISAKRAAQSGSNHSKGTKDSLLGNYSGQKKYLSEESKTIPDVLESKKTAILNILESKSTAIQNASEHQKTVISNISDNKKAAIPNVPTKKKIYKTYMEPHKEENRQPKIRTNNLWGEDEYAHQRIVALRLMEGDPVPDGYVKIRCPYCAADNLVTKHCKEYHSCYFCRVPID